MNAKTPANKSAKVQTIVEAKYAEFKKAYDNQLVMEGRSQDALYGTIAKTLGFTRLVHETANEEAFKEFCKERNVDPEVGENDNEYLPIVKALFRKPKENSNDTQPVTSSYKYAKAIRHFMEKGIGEDEVAKYIKSFKITIGGRDYTKLDGIYKADNKAHPDTRGGSNAAATTIETLKGQWSDKSLARFEAPDDARINTCKGLVVMVGQPDGRDIVVRAFLDQEDAIFENVLTKFKQKAVKAVGMKKTIWQKPEVAAEKPVVAKEAEEAA